MPLRIPTDIRAAVIRGWLNGYARDIVASGNHLSAGAVTNIVNEWRAELGFPTADALREVAVVLRRNTITAAQCATGFRLANILKNLGVGEGEFHSFVLET